MFIDKLLTRPGKQPPYKVNHFGPIVNPDLSFTYFLLLLLATGLSRMGAQ